MIPVSQPHLLQVRDTSNQYPIPSALITVATSGKDYSLVYSTNFRPATPRSIQHRRWYRALTIAESDPDSLNPALMPTSPVHSL